MRAGWLARSDAFGRLWRMWDWSTAASLATALGTLVLALATFVAVRAANRAARTAEYSMQIGIRPLLMSSSQHYATAPYVTLTATCPTTSAS